MSAEPLTCSVVIPTWNRADELQRCLAALRRATHPPLEIIIIDNGSQPAVAVDDPAVRVIRNDSNRGFAAACNQGMAAAQGDAVLLLNQDVELEPHYLAEGLRVLAEHPQVGAVTGVLYHPETGAVDTAGLEPGLLKLSPYDRSTAVEGYVFGVSGAAPVYRQAALAAVVDADEYLRELYGSYYEDVDLSWRLQRAGWRCWCCPAARGTHPRRGAPAHAPEIQRQAFGNRYRLVLLNATWWQLALYGPWWVMLETVRLVRWSWAKPYLWRAPVEVLGELRALWRRRG